MRQGIGHQFVAHGDQRPHLAVNQQHGHYFAISAQDLAWANPTASKLAPASASCVGLTSFAAGYGSTVSNASLTCRLRPSTSRRSAGDEVAAAEDDEVAGCDVRCRDVCDLAVAHHPGRQRHLAAQAFGGAFGPVLLRHVQHHGRENDEGNDGVARHVTNRGRHRGGEQDEDEGAMVAPDEYGQ